MLPDGNSLQECVRPNLFHQTLSSSGYTADAHKNEDRGKDAEDGGWEEDVRNPGPQSGRYRGGTNMFFRDAFSMTKLNHFSHLVLFSVLPSYFR